MHQFDLNWYVACHPNSELARLATGGAEYTDAQTSDPSDSDPGGTALMSGGDPKVTGVAPTILELLGLSPSSLQAVQREGTQVLPGLGMRD